MSDRKRVVERYMEGFRRSDHGMVLSCLAEGVAWDMPGHFRLEGKAAFDGEIENPAFVGRPEIEVTRLIEGEGCVVAEGRVRAARREGGELRAVFCDVFEFGGGELITRLVSYVMEVK
jgi:hypothetical protein